MTYSRPILHIWLLFGLFMVGLTPLPLYTPLFGYAPVLWLTITPAILLIVTPSPATTRLSGEA